MAETRMVQWVFRKENHCPGCGRRAIRKIRLEEWMGPENKNPDGSVKTEIDIVRGMKVKADDWLRTPSVCRKCVRAGVTAEKT